MVMERSQSIGAQFQLINPQGSVFAPLPSAFTCISAALRPVVGFPPTHLRDELQQATPPGECNFRIFYSALKSTRPVERFMHLYNILGTLCNDKQRLADAFIAAEPGAPQTLDPRCLRRAPQPMETVYTRLRNIFAHKRHNVSLNTTKTEMEAHVASFAALTK